MWLPPTRCGSPAVILPSRRPARPRRRECRKDLRSVLVKGGEALALRGQDGARSPAPEPRPAHPPQPGSPPVPPARWENAAPGKEGERRKEEGGEGEGRGGAGRGIQKDRRSKGRGGRERNDEGRRARGAKGRRNGSRIWAAHHQHAILGKLTQIK